MEREDEDKKLTQVLALVRTQISELADELKKTSGSVLESRKNMWAETHVIRSFDDAATLVSLLSEVTFNEKRFLSENTRLNNLKRMLDSPYFGRIDFKEDGYAEIESLYIGGHSLFDDKTKAFLVYDWRAPISSMYYDYGVGRASFVAPDGDVSGEIYLKRQYHIERGELVYWFDSDINIDDDILQWELSRASDSKIKSIIHTIQREQNKAIRCEAKRVMVFGPAGSGKTSVGLHRLAYLLYRRRGALTSSHVRIFSSSHVFSSYIAGIIPELGEEDITTLDFKSFIGDCLGKRYAFHYLYEQIQYLTTHGNTTRRQGIALKYSPDFVAYVENSIKHFAPVIDKDILFNGDMICERDKIAALYSDRTAAGNLATKTGRVTDHVNRCFEAYFKANKQAIAQYYNDLLDDNLLDGEVRQKFDRYKADALEALKQRLFPAPERLYADILKGYIGDKGLPEKLYRYTLRILNSEALFFEDILVVAYIGVLTGAVKKDRNVKHILIDEAQDMNLLQHKILQGVFADAEMTILADVNQAIFADISIGEKETLQALYGDSITVIELSKSYRSTLEINRFASQIIGQTDESAFYQRSGNEPVITQTADAAASAAQIIQNLPKEFKSVGILLSDSLHAHNFYRQMEAFKREIRVSIIASPDDAFHSGVLVMPVSFAKGLEFDAVIIPEYGADYLKDYYGRKTLYLMCTRALHQLYLLENVNS